MNAVKSSKKDLAVLLTLVMLLSMVPMMAMADGHEMAGVAFRIDVMGYWVDGEWVEADVAPYIQDSRTMVPVAHAARAIDAAVAWNADTQMVTVTKDETVVTMTIGSNVMMRNEEVVTMDTVPVIKDLGNGLGRTMLPVAWLAKALDVPYTWNAETNTATFMPATEEEVVEPLIFDEAGTFGPASGTVTSDNDVIIRAQDVVLQNYIITGDLIIAEEVGEGDVTLNNVTVEGELIVRGGGEDSIHINGGSIKTVRIEATASGAVRIVANDVEGMEVIVAEQAADKKIVLEGTFEKVTIEAKDVTIETRGETTIKELVVAETAENVTVTLSAETTVEKVVVDSKTVSFEGEGTVKATEGIEKDSVTYGDDVTKPAPTPRPSGGGGGSSSSSSSGTTYYAPKIEEVKVNGVTVNHNADNHYAIQVRPNEEYNTVSVKIDNDSTVTVSHATKSISANINAGSTVTINTAWLGTQSILEATGIQGDGVMGSTLIGEVFTVTLENSKDPSKKTTYTVEFVEPK